MSRKRRLGVCGALTLLTLTMITGAFVSAAGAQVTTAEFDVQVRVVGGTALKQDMSFSLNGAPGVQFNPNGVNILTGLDVSQTYTVTPVDFAGYTVTVDDAIPGIDCTDVTLVVGTPGFCRMTFTFIEPSTTTTTTTTTTLPPVTTTTGGVGQTTKHDADRSRSHVAPNLSIPTGTCGSRSLGTDAAPQPHRGDPITLSGGTLTLNIPASLLQTGYDAGLVKNGDQVPSVVTPNIAGLEHDREDARLRDQRPRPWACPSGEIPKGKKAQPLKATVPLPDTHWTPVSDSADVTFSEKSLVIVSTIQPAGHRQSGRDLHVQAGHLSRVRRPRCEGPADTSTTDWRQWPWSWRRRRDRRRKPTEARHSFLAPVRTRGRCWWSPRSASTSACSPSPRRSAAGVRYTSPDWQNGRLRLKTPRWSTQSFRNCPIRWTSPIGTGTTARVWVGCPHPPRERRRRAGLNLTHWGVCECVVAGFSLD